MIMESSNITIIFLTANKVPPQWAEFHKEKLLEAIGSSPIITLSMKPLDWGTNILQDQPYSASNIYFQLLRGAKIATTDYIGVAEDDMLYPKEHFEYRPPLDVFAYNMNKFSLFTWGKPTYFWKDRVSNSTLIASRRLIIEALEERFNKHPNGTPQGITGELGRRKVDDTLGLTPHKSAWFSTDTSVIRIDHEYGIDHLTRTHRKKMGILRSYDIPYWGKATDLIKKFKE
jgi:hypothetical protein